MFKNHFIKIFKLLIGCLVLTHLSACVTTAVTTGADVVYNRYEITQSLENHYLKLAADKIFYEREKHFKKCNISVTVFNYNALLSGQVRKEHLRKEAEDIVKSLPGIQHVYNELTISKAKSYPARLNDSWLTLKIRTKLLSINNITPSKIKIVTENKVVYLLGTVDRREANIATKIVENTSGVKRLVKFFTYIEYSQV